mgnify:CR=1 FL=1
MASYQTHNPEELRALAATLLPELVRARVVLLSGELGAGKTTFVQGVAKALGIDDVVRSPTYTLINEYQVTHPEIDHLIHVDLYRLESVDTVEMVRLGIDEWLTRPRTLMLIEWPERCEKKPEGLLVRIEIEGDERRISMGE